MHMFYVLIGLIFQLWTVRVFLIFRAFKLCVQIKYNLFFSFFCFILLRPDGRISLTDNIHDESEKTRQIHDTTSK